MKIPRKTSRRLLRLGAISLAMYLGFGAFLWWREPHFVYLPREGPSQPAQAGAPRFTRHEIPRAGQDHPLVYWENSAAPDRPTVLYFHGNGGGLYFHARYLNALDAHGLHVLALEYPGYPGVSGHPSQQALVGDAVALYDEIAPQLHQKPPFIWGFSLGSGVATQLAYARPARGLVLEAPFTAVVDRASELFPLYPIRYMMRDQYRSRDVIARIHAPLLILHGTEDRIIPLAHGRALFALAEQPKTLNIYEARGHLDLDGSTAYDDATAFMKAQR